MNFLIETFEGLQQALFESVLQPIAFALGHGHLLEKAYEGAGWVVVGLLQIAVMVTVIGPMQRLWPAESQKDRQALGVDVLYTLIHRLGLFKLGMFFTLDFALEQGWGVLRSQGWPTFHLDSVWPGVTDVAWVSFVLYLVVFDFVNYAIHRAQHQSSAWWALHSLHHAQRQMSMWSDNRNHLLDDMLTSVVVSALALLIGVGPGQFVALVAIGQLSESFQHANVRMWFGPIGERLWVSPRFHRRHHSIGIGHEFDRQDRKVLGGCNFGVLLPWWDQLFGTADFQQRYDPTGVRDQVEQGRDYGQGFWAQQWQGVLRLMGRA
ncbi:sterol desaturase family protein [Limnohabitans sp. Rim8]|jgi:sterol desaturase/sphingolipid hydroxylase (fatty acid hydroxylase superfamily)|uniref:sterol desaturase family protein n=1 Tax=Limnohabitans sp. Rim8 TaxID=1100718 RepID=UPI0025D7805F|nr:sterol desaturase family protein [Limnohabitans sp. Rim8]